MIRNLLFLVFCFLFVLNENHAQQSSLLNHNNLRKLSKIADKKAGVYNAEKDNPIRRIELENSMLIDPRTRVIPDNIREKELMYVNSNTSRLQKRSSVFGVELNAASWKNRGPFNVGGRTRALAIDVSNENVLLAGGASGGVWRSTNSGSTWSKTTGASDLHSVTSIAQDPRQGNQNIWYYTTGELVGNSAAGGGANSNYRGNGIYKSTDGGITWKVLPITASNTPQTYDSYFDYNWRVCVNPINGDVYAATIGAIHKSSNGGTSWSLVLSAGNAYHTDIISTNSGVLYATIDSDGNPSKGIFRSINGTDWKSITPSDFPSSYNRIVLASSKANPNIVYFLAETPSAGKLDHSLYKYTYASGIGNGDGTSGNGGSWENRSANIPAFGGSNGDFDSQGSYDLIIAVQPDNVNIVYVGGTNLYRSKDAFSSSSNTSWIGGYSPANNVSRYENHHPDIHALAFYSSSSVKMLCGHDGGVSLTENNLSNNSGILPVTWKNLNNGYLTSQAYAIAIDHSKLNDDKILAGFQDNGTWSTGSNVATGSWLEEFSGDGGYCAFANGGLTRYISSQNANIFRFAYNASGQMTGWARIKPTNLTNPLFITPYLLDPTDNNIMYLAGNDRIWRNNDLSKIPDFDNNTTTVSWEELTNTTVSEPITALDASSTGASRLYFGTSRGKLYRIDNPKQGNSAPTEISGSNFPADAYTSCIKVDPENSNRIFVVFSNYLVKSVFYTTDGGASWIDISGNLEQNSDGSGNGPSVRWIEILKMNKDLAYFVGTSTGVYSTDVLNGASTTWTQQGANSIGNVVVKMIKTRSDGTVVAGTHGNGIYSAKFTNVSCQNAVFSSISKVSCGDYFAPSGKVLSATGVYKDTILNNSGCDSIITINLTVKEISSTQIDTAACYAYKSPSGKIFNTPGTYTDTLVNTLGCDSLITINLSFNPSTKSEISRMACTSYTAPSGMTYTKSGVYTDVIPNINGCDSIITLKLTITDGNSSINDSACVSYTSLGGKVYNSSGTFKDTINNPQNIYFKIEAPLSIAGYYNFNYGQARFGWASEDIRDEKNALMDTLKLVDDGTTGDSLGCNQIINDVKGKIAVIYRGGCNFSIKAKKAQDAGAIAVVLINSTDDNIYMNGGDTGVLVKIPVLTLSASDGAIIKSKLDKGENVVAFIGKKPMDACILNLNLKINQASSSTISQTACSQYKSPSGNIYTISGQYRDTINNFSGCDSIITINLTIKNNSLSSINPVVCNKYTSPSGKELTVSGIFKDTILNSNGCDSVITINLTVKKVDVSILQTGNSLKANASGATYFWMDCNNALSRIDSATNQSFKPLKNGSYAVEIRQNGCRDTSECFKISNVGILSADFENSLLVYPNPTQGLVNIDLGNSYPEITVAVRDLKSQLIHQIKYFNQSKINLEITGASGYYFIDISVSDKLNSTVKVFKQ